MNLVMPRMMKIYSIKLMDELLLKYRDRFGENFPVFCFMGMDEAEVVGMIMNCLISGIPCKVEAAPGILF